MADKLVTIATFDTPPKARMAKNALDAAGIKSTVADETTVAMDWLLGAAIGWVKVQVMEEDAERAVSVLEEALGTGDEPVDQEALAAEAEAAPAAEGRDHSIPVQLVRERPSTPADVAAPPLSEREEYTQRFFLAAIFGLIIPLVWFYAVYLFLNAAFGEGPLSPQGQSKLRIGGVLLALGAFMAYFLFRYYGDPFF